MIEALIRVFAERLFHELSCGVPREYVLRQANLNVWKGKLLFSEHLRRNVANAGRVFVEYEEFLPDTPMNRLLRAACEKLQRLTAVPATQERLAHSLMWLGGVSSGGMRAEDAAKVHLTRQNERFRPLVAFSRLVLAGASPAATMGGHATFSLLFDMNRVFEDYVRGLIRRDALRGPLAGARCVAPSRQQVRHLLERSEGSGRGRKVYALKPDVLVDLSLIHI